jgi:transposase
MGEFPGEIEIDDSYLEDVRNGKKGRETGSKTSVFGILKRGRKVYTAIVDDTKVKHLYPIIKGKMQPDSIVCTNY